MLTLSSLKFNRLQKKIRNVPELTEEIKNSLRKNISQVAEIIFGGGLILDASDIHFEPGKETVKIRFRIDGILQDVSIFDPDLYEKLLSRIKLLSGIKLNISDRPQNGRFSIILTPSGQEIEIRASTLPSEYGESLVLRILNPKNLIEIEELGLRKDLLETFQEQIKKPNGMIIVTGPTGSGKTTTLYAFLKKLQQPTIKVITIEDPIEYHLAGISQTQTKPEAGYSFAEGLKSIMRQDPDVILVGEIRDAETAQIAIQASLTGHLVFSTLHTNNAAGAITRLTSLEARPSNIASALNMIVAQRLVRKVCPKCFHLQTPSPAQLKKIETELKGIPKKIKGRKIPRAKGCQNCNFTGYRGRVGLFEAFIVDREMEKFILENPPTGALDELARKKGMLSMYQDGLIKVLEGATTLEEVERVAQEK